MQKILLVFIVNIALFAQNPQLFCALGDVIYNNVEKIQGLEKIDEYKVYKKKIQEYVSAVKKLKKDGFTLDAGINSDKMKYFDKLREISRTNDFFVRSVKRNLELAMASDNSKLFIELVSTGLIDEKKSKNEIIDYYFSHSDEINATGVIQKYLDENKKLQAKKEYRKNVNRSKKLRKLEKIKRIRRKDKLEQQKLEEQLNEEAQKKSSKTI